MAIKCLMFLYVPIFVLCSMLWSSMGVEATNVTDKKALLSFKASIEKDPFRILSSWNDSFHFCNWFGVSCSRRHSDRVVSLNLNSQLLVGTLSPHLGNLSFLNHIDLQNNTFHGHIPQEFGRLGRLQYLKLSNNSLTGNIPANLSHCSNLVYLDLTQNNLVGNIPIPIPTQPWSSPKLKYLALSENSLTGTIPPSLGNLSSLVLISLLINHLQGPIPPQLFQHQGLRFLGLSENNLTGEIPDSLYNISTLEIFQVDFNYNLNGTIPSNIGLLLPNLVDIIIAYNSFTGIIPPTLSNASMLRQIVFAANNFTGSIPKDLGKLPNLQVVIFSSNQLDDDLSFMNSLTNCSILESITAESSSLRGSVPTSIANLTRQIITITLGDNQLQGTIPIGLENLINLQILHFGNNFFEGPILVNLGIFHRLRYLYLFGNKFTGTIPSSLGNLSLLSNLDMSSNNLNGSIPPSLGSCRNLIKLDLSYNSLTGSIPRQVMSISSLAISFTLAANALTGPIPSEVGLLQNLLILDLSDNRLSSSVPTSIGKCTSTEEIYLSRNSFVGEIPQDFKALSSLKKLDISDNNFSGQIPTSLAELDGLIYLNMSFNQLQGEVPKRGIFMNATQVSLLGNNGLCGGVSALKLPSCPSQINHSHALKVVISIVIAIAVLLALFVFIFIFCKRRGISKKKNASEPSPEEQFPRLSYGELFKATNGFSTANMIGGGSHGTVYKGVIDKIRIQVAVKVLNLHQRGATSSFLLECQALRSIRHRNLLKILSVCSSVDNKGNDFKALIYEFMPNGSLEQWLHVNDVKDDSGKLKPIQRLNIAIDIAYAMEYLHNGSSSTIIHGDLKPSNVLLDKDMTAQIGDFGLAKIVSTIPDEVQHLPSTSTAIKGTIGYIAPEYGMGDRVSIEGDVYSYGILLLEMFTGKKPTNELFSDNINLHSFVESSLPERVMEIVDPSIGRERFIEFVISALRIGVACSMDQPSERMKMRDVICELERIKVSYEKDNAKEL